MSREAKQFDIACLNPTRQVLEQSDPMETIQLLAPTSPRVGVEEATVSFSMA